MLIAIKDGKILMIESENNLEALCDDFQLFNWKNRKKKKLTDEDYKTMLKAHGYKIIKIEGEIVI